MEPPPNPGDDDVSWALDYLPSLTKKQIAQKTMSKRSSQSVLSVLPVSSPPRVLTASASARTLSPSASLSTFDIRKAVDPKQERVELKRLGEAMQLFQTRLSSIRDTEEKMQHPPAASGLEQPDSLSNISDPLQAFVQGTNSLKNAAIDEPGS